MADIEGAVRRAPLDPRGWRALGEAREGAKRYRDALDAYRAAQVVDPGAGDCALLRAGLLFRLERVADAHRAYRLALARFGPRAPLFSNLGACLREIGELDAARAAFRRALCLKPRESEVWRNLANLVRTEERMEDADRLYRRALAIAPADGGLHWNRAMVLLKAGHLREGFREFEWRWHGERFSPRMRAFDVPSWDGSRFDGRTLYVHAEQGFGDALQFARFLPRVAALKGAAGRLVFECHPELVSLLDRISGVDAIQRRGDAPPRIDVHAPLLSLPALLGLSTLEDLAVETPYLSPPPGADPATPEIAPDRVNVGFVFAGNPNYPGDRDRSTRLADWRAVFAVGGVRLFCLQKGARETEVADAPAGIVRLNERLSSFAETATVMSRLDLVITTCTAAAHLAGALGVPVWIALARNADWRWMLDRDDSPWYPTARLYRQAEAGDWTSVFTAIARDLATLVHDRRVHTTNAR